jgi:hypothetical protein
MSEMSRGVVEDDQVGQQGVELDQFLLLFGVVVGQHAAEAEPLGEPVVGLDLVGRRGDPRPQRRVGQIPQHYVESDLSSVALRLGSGYRLAGAALNLDNRLS